MEISWKYFLPLSCFSPPRGYEVRTAAHIHVVSSIYSESDPETISTLGGENGCRAEEVFFFVDRDFLEIFEKYIISKCLKIPTVIKPNEHGGTNAYDLDCERT